MARASFLMDRPVANLRSLGTVVHSTAIGLCLCSPRNHGHAHDRRPQGPARHDRGNSADDMLSQASRLRALNLRFRASGPLPERVESISMDCSCWGCTCWASREAPRAPFSPAGSRCGAREPRSLWKCLRFAGPTAAFWPQINGPDPGISHSGRHCDRGGLPDGLGAWLFSALRRDCAGLHGQACGGRLLRRQAKSGFKLSSAGSTPKNEQPSWSTASWGVSASSLSRLSGRWGGIGGCPPRWSPGSRLAKS